MVSVVAVSHGLADTVTVVVDLVPTIRTRPDSAVLAVGDSLLPYARLSDSLGQTFPDTVLSWSSSEPSVAAVDAEGTVVAGAPGTTVVTASKQGVSADVTVRVLDQRFSFIGLTAGGTGSNCGLTAADGVYCWGISPALVPSPVSFSSIAAGEGHACGLATDSAVYCWGSNDVGQLGNGSTVGRPDAARIASDEKFVSIDADGTLSCGLTLEGRVFCWGYNLWPLTLTSTPASVSGSTLFRTVSVGWSHVCGIARDQMTYCWGSAAGGALGDGANQNASAPSAVAGGLEFTTVSAGSLRTCALTAAGATYCWGGGTLTPQLISGLPPLVDIDVYDQLCGRTDEGRVLCWNFGGRGNLSEIPFTQPVTAVTVTYQHSCALVTTGGAYCWGYGELGDGNARPTGTSTSPRHVVRSVR
jgi:alpha-tubulin suppressor-like RCC1 family protein